MFKKIIILLTLVLFFVSGCSNYYVNKSENNTETPRGPAHQLFMRAPAFYQDESELLLMVSMAKFSEFDNEARFDPHGVIYALNELEELFVPGYTKQGFDLNGISISSVHWIRLLYGDTTPMGYTNFEWSRYLSAEIAVNMLFGRGAVAEYIEERNGITYGVTEWVGFDTDEVIGYNISWAQHGHAFMTSLPTAYFTLEQALAFSYAVPLIAWQLDGNAVSVSIQDMEDITIIALSDIDPTDRSGVSTLSSTRQEVIISNDNLYLPSRTRDGSLELIGYRWLIDAATNRYQYVLAPGIYEFRAAGATINSELLVRHFEAGEVVTLTDFTAEVSAPDVTEFALIVTPDEVYDFTTEPGEQEPIDPLFIYIKELQIEGPMWSDVHFDHELREGFIHFSLASIGESVSIVPNIFRLYENGSLVDVSGEIARVTYYLGGVEYDTMQNGSLGLFCSFDLSQAINLEIVVELADGVLVSYSFGYEIEVVVARGGGLDELSLDEQGLDELIEDQP